jgi:DNA polymerase-3 subunit alpha
MVADLLARATEQAGRGPRAPVHLFLRLVLDGQPREGIVPMGEFVVTPQIKGAVKSLPGVEMVEDL